MQKYRETRQLHNSYDILCKTSCARGDTICLRPCKMTISSHLVARWWCCSGITIFSYLFARRHLFRHLFRHVGISNKLTFDILTLKMVSESHVTWPTSVPILVFLGLSVLELGPMYATADRQTSDVRQKHYALWGGGIIINQSINQSINQLNSDSSAHKNGRQNRRRQTTTEQKQTWHNNNNNYIIFLEWTKSINFKVHYCERTTSTNYKIMSK